MHTFSRFGASLILALSILAISCGGGKKVVGTGALLDDLRALTPFSEITLDAPVNLVVTGGSVQSVNVRAQGQILAILTTEVKGDRLTINMAKEAQMDGGTTVEVVVPELEALTMNSSGSASLNNMKAGKLKININSSGSVNAKDLVYDDIKVYIDGSGDVELGGKAEDLEIMLDSSGDVDAYDLAVQDAKITNKGSGEVRVMVSDELNAEIKGSGNVFYRGEPKVELSDDGSGELKGDN